ncbi:hypothetical protein BA011_06130 [Rhizobium leguminosarum]|uniref:Uncharacterized protein n=1 Tax=Rhizobium leguminosarum TaxID=384 RepID=A0A1B1C6C1_RHILE|nr:hypothetical protein BA011_06130 [Rhizobium leguminosarum]
MVENYAFVARQGQRSTEAVEEIAKRPLTKGQLTGDEVFPDQLDVRQRDSRVRSPCTIASR